jgi:hypothetical protein
MPLTVAGRLQAAVTEFQEIVRHLRMVRGHDPGRPVPPAVIDR